MDKIIGSLLVEVNTKGYHRVVEIAITEGPTGHVQPGGVRDALTLQRPVRVPPVRRVQEAMELAKWCFANKAVFAGRVSRGLTITGHLAEWPPDQN